MICSAGPQSTWLLVVLGWLESKKCYQNVTVVFPITTYVIANNSLGCLLQKVMGLVNLKFKAYIYI
jgi:hypothetical protein